MIKGYKNHDYLNLQYFVPSEVRDLEQQLKDMIEEHLILGEESNKVLEKLKRMQCCGNCIGLDWCGNESIEANYPFGVCGNWQMKESSK